MVTYERLKELLHYDPDTGVFTWRVYRARSAKAGYIAGTPDRHGYCKIDILHRKYFAHRLAWLYMYGNFPVNAIDHINGVPSDNRISNLRDVPQSENVLNLRAARSNNTTGFLGVTRSRHRFHALIAVNGKKHFLGAYATAELAHAAYLKAKRELHTTCTI